MGCRVAYKDALPVLLLRPLLFFQCISVVFRFRFRAVCRSHFAVIMDFKINLRSLSRRFTVYRITGLEKIGRRITGLRDYRISKHPKTEARVNQDHSHDHSHGSRPPATATGHGATTATTTATSHGHGPATTMATGHGHGPRCGHGHDHGHGPRPPDYWRCRFNPDYKVSRLTGLSGQPVYQITDRHT